jgi:hypothetical protein
LTPTATTGECREPMAARSMISLLSPHGNKIDDITSVPPWQQDSVISLLHPMATRLDKEAELVACKPWSKGPLNPRK